MLKEEAEKKKRKKSATGQYGKINNPRKGHIVNFFLKVSPAKLQFVFIIRVV